MRTHDTIEQIRQDIRKLDEQLEIRRAERVAEGLPPDPPAPFVELPMAWALYKRCKPLIQYAVQYAGVVDKTNEIIKITDEQMAWIKSFEMDVFFISNGRKHIGLIALGIEGIYSKLTNYTEYETAGQLLRELVRYITMIRPDYGNEYMLDTFTYDHRADRDENDRNSREAAAEVERLEDDEYFQEEYVKLTEYYESIKHLY